MKTAKRTLSLLLSLLLVLGTVAVGSMQAAATTSITAGVFDGLNAQLHYGTANYYKVYAAQSDGSSVEIVYLKAVKTDDRLIVYESSEPESIRNTMDVSADFVGSFTYDPGLGIETWTISLSNSGFYSSIDSLSPLSFPFAQEFTNLGVELPLNTVNYYKVNAIRSDSGLPETVYLKAVKYNGYSGTAPVLNVYEANTTGSFSPEVSEAFLADASGWTNADRKETWTFYLKSNKEGVYTNPYSRIVSFSPLCIPVTATQIWDSKNEFDQYNQVIDNTITSYRITDESGDILDFSVKKASYSLQVSLDGVSFCDNNAVTPDGITVNALCIPAVGSTSPEEWIITVTGLDQNDGDGKPHEYKIVQDEIRSPQYWQKGETKLVQTVNGVTFPDNIEETISYKLMLASGNSKYEILQIDKTILYSKVTRLSVKGLTDRNNYVYATVTGAVSGEIYQNPDLDNTLNFNNNSVIRLSDFTGSADGVTVSFNIGIDNGSASVKIRLTPSGMLTYDFNGLPIEVFCPEAIDGSVIPEPIEVEHYYVSEEPLSAVDSRIVSEPMDYMPIDCYEALLVFANRVNNGETELNGKLLCDIDASASNPESDSYNAYFTAWTPIGDRSEISYDIYSIYTGTFDGDGHVITGLTFDASEGFAGLFGCVGEGGMVKNVGLEGGKITGNAQAGGVAGSNNGTVMNCYNTGSVSGTYAGGVVGINILGTVMNCYNTGDVSGEYFVGGVAGYVGGTIENCYSTGTVALTIGPNSESRAGGVAGYVGGTIENCYYDSSVLTGFSTIGDGNGTNVTGLTTAQMTGADALSDDNMKFVFSEGEENPWLVRENNCKNDYYPHLKGFNLDEEAAQIPAESIDAENWPPKTETGTGEHKYGDTGDARFTCSVCGQVDNDVKTAVELADTKEAAKKALDEYKNPADYRPEQQAALDDAISAGKDAIDNATDTDGVAAALENAKAAIDNIKTDAQLTAEELDSEKTSAKQALDEYKNPADYRPDQQAALDDAISAGKDAIDNATDTDGVAAALENAKAAIDAIKTDAQMTADEQAEFDEYKQAQKDEVAGLAKEGDSEESAALIKAAQDAIDAVTFDKEKSPEENKAAVDAAANLTQLNEDLETQRAADQLAADKAAFDEYKNKKKEEIDALAQEGDSDAVKELIEKAKDEIDKLTYDESKSLDENKVAADAAENLTQLKENIAAHRKEYTATFIADGKTVEEIKFTIDTKSLKEPAVPAKEGYEGKWSEYTLAAADIQIQSVYTPIEYTATFVDENGETVKEVKFTVETEKLEEPEVPAKEGCKGAWEEYELTAGDITVKPVYTPQNICKLDNEYHGDSLFGKMLTFLHNQIWYFFRMLGFDLYVSVTFDW